LIEACRSKIEWNTPRFNRRLVSVAKNPSTALSQEHEVGQTYDSLSKVAFAITGTNWNGPRFFGLRNKEDRLAMGEARS